MEKKKKAEEKKKKEIWPIVLFAVLLIALIVSLIHTATAEGHATAMLLEPAATAALHQAGSLL